MVKPIQALSLGAAILLTMVPAVAQQQDENPLGQPLVSADGSVRDDAFIRMPLRSEDRAYADIDGGRMKEILMEVDAISLRDRNAGTVFWGRNVGTDGHIWTQDWVERYFEQDGLENVRRQSFDLRPVDSESLGDQLRAERSVVYARIGETASGRASTPQHGRDFELVWVRLGSDADYLGRDVSGKAVLILDLPRPGTLRHSIRTEGAVERAYANGAAAVGIV